MAAPFSPNFHERPRMLEQALTPSPIPTPEEVAGFLAMGQWNGLPVSFFRPAPAGNQPPLPRRIESAGKYNFDLTTLVIPKGFANARYQLNFSGKNAIVNRLPSDPPLADPFSSLILLNVIDNGQNRDWLCPPAIHPCTLFTSAVGKHGRGDERCALLITYPSDAEGQEQFQVFEYTGQITVNQWQRTVPGEKPMKQEINLVEEPADQKKSYFLALLLPDNSLCYYLIPEHKLESELAIWHEELKKAEATGSPVMVAINGPIYHRDDWGICFSEFVEPVID